MLNYTYFQAHFASNSSKQEDLITLNYTSQVHLHCTD